MGFDREKAFVRERKTGQFKMGLDRPLALKVLPRQEVAPLLARRRDPEPPKSLRKEGKAKKERGMNFAANFFHGIADKITRYGDRERFENQLVGREAKYTILLWLVAGALLAALPLFFGVAIPFLTPLLAFLLKGIIASHVGAGASILTVAVGGLLGVVIGAVHSFLNAIMWPDNPGIRAVSGASRLVGWALDGIGYALVTLAIAAAGLVTFFSFGKINLLSGNKGGKGGGGAGK